MRGFGGVGGGTMPGDRGAEYTVGVQIPRDSGLACLYVMLYNMTYN